MKLQIEGSSGDVRSLFNDAAAAKEAAAAQIRIDALEKELASSSSRMEKAVKENEALKSTLSTAAVKFGELNNGLNSLRMELGAKNSHVASQDAEIQRLKFSMSDPIRLSAEQDAIIEGLWQDMVTAYGIKPLMCSPPDPNKPVPAEYVISTIMACLGNGDKVGACKEIRAATGLSLMKTKTMVDKALMAFGCNVGERGAPQAMIGPLAKPAEKQG